MKLSASQVITIKSSIENTRQDLLEAIKFNKDKNYASVLCKVNSAIFNNVKTLSLINKAEKKGD